MVSARRLPPSSEFENALGREAPLFKDGYRQDAHAAASTAVKVLVGVYGVYDAQQN